MWRDKIKLLSVAGFVNDMGDFIEEDIEREVFANKMAIGQAEHYEAMKSGLKPEIKFNIRTFEYEEEEKLRYKGTTYKIIRTYDKGEFIEIVCEGLL